LNLADLTEEERTLIEGMRILARLDPRFKFLASSRASRDRIMIDRGALYNGNGSSVIKQLYYKKDQSAFHKAFDPMNRLENICCTKEAGQGLPDATLLELPQDAANYLDMWLCCREDFKANGGG